MKKEKKPFDFLQFEITVCVIGSILAFTLLTVLPQLMQPETGIGRAGLLAYRRQVIWYLVGRFAALASPAIIVLLSGFFTHLMQHERPWPSKERLCAAGMVWLVFAPVFLLMPHRSGFEVQTERNGYFGLRPMKAIALLLDINKDLHMETADLPVQTRYLDCKREHLDYVLSGRHGGGGRVEVKEYALCDADTGEIIAQIPKSEYEIAKERLCIYTAHEITLYPNSGLIAAFDDGTLDGLNDIETLFTLTLDGNTVSRTVHPRENEFLHFYMIVERDGEQIGQFGTATRTEEWFSLGLNTTVYLTMTYKGETTRVSNVLNF